MKNVRLILLIALMPLASTLSYAQAQTASVNAVNVSTMVTLAPGGTATMGFVVGNLPPGQTTAWYIIRGVGPSLTQFGISNSAPQPKLTIYNSQGQNIIGTPGIPYAFNYGASFAQVGAFPLIKGSADAYYIIQVLPGSYTVQVSDSSGKGGVVLIEAYASPTPVIVAE